MKDQKYVSPPDRSPKGIFLAGCVNNCGINFVIDSGASITIVSTRIFDKIPEFWRPDLEECSFNVLVADGTYLKIAGKCTLDKLIFSMK